MVWEAKVGAVAYDSSLTDAVGASFFTSPYFVMSDSNGNLKLYEVDDTGLSVTEVDSTSTTVTGNVKKAVTLSDTRVAFYTVDGSDEGGVFLVERNEDTIAVGAELKLTLTGGQKTPFENCIARFNNNYFAVVGTEYPAAKGWTLYGGLSGTTVTEPYAGVDLDCDVNSSMALGLQIASPVVRVGYTPLVWVQDGTTTDIRTKNVYPNSATWNVITSGTSLGGLDAAPHSISVVIQSLVGGGTYTRLVALTTNALSGNLQTRFYDYFGNPEYSFAGAGVPVDLAISADSKRFLSLDPYGEFVTGATAATDVSRIDGFMVTADMEVGWEAALNYNESVRANWGGSVIRTAETSDVSYVFTGTDNSQTWYQVVTLNDIEHTLFPGSTPVRVYTHGSRR